MALFYGQGSFVSRLQSHYEGTAYIIATQSPGVTGMSLKPLSFEPMTLGLGIQRLYYFLCQTSSVIILTSLKAVKNSACSYACINSKCKNKS